jgi:hypothetical protein
MTDYTIWHALEDLEIACVFLHGEPDLAKENIIRVINYLEKKREG